MEIEVCRFCLGFYDFSNNNETFTALINLRSRNNILNYYLIIIVKNNC